MIIMHLEFYNDKCIQIRKNNQSLFTPGSQWLPISVTKGVLNLHTNMRQLTL